MAAYKPDVPISHLFGALTKLGASEAAPNIFETGENFVMRLPSSGMAPGRPIGLYGLYVTRYLLNIYSRWTNVSIFVYKIRYKYFRFRCLRGFPTFGKS